MTHCPLQSNKQKRLATDPTGSAHLLQRVNDLLVLLLQELDLHRAEAAIASLLRHPTSGARASRSTSAVRSW